MAETELHVGDMAPDFTLPAEDGRMVSLSDYRAKRVVLYFYPQDDTPGCTTQACGFRDAYPQIEEQNAVVLGVSPDSEQSHRKFKTKYDLPFTLLCDVDKTAAQAYGVWKEKTMYGRKMMGIERSTFLIDENGKIAGAWRKVKVDGHVGAVLEAAKKP